ncbi:copper chaperone PCu(A)C [Corynebacterium flavescens]|uniref:copper chaperone PCu(A)C n=1 Tax=Corynebacterium flavescens TaxID=28028 RepID=UPI003FD69BFB
MTSGMRFTLGIIAASTLALSACSASDEPASTSESAAQSSAQSAAPSSAASSAQEGEVVLSQGVVRAAEEGSDMTAIFGTLENNSDSDVEVTGFHSSANADMNQLHQTVNGVMSQMTEPMVIPAHGTFELKPGGNHLMLMGLHQPIKAGETIDVTLELKDGSEIDLGQVEARSMGAGGEAYGDIEGHGGQGEHSDMSGMDGMSGMHSEAKPSESAEH